MHFTTSPFLETHAMNASQHDAQPSNSARMPEGAHVAAASHDDEDLALGWECADPALQIEVWGLEATDQPLQRFF
jgi:hypothetical protein